MDLEVPQVLCFKDEDKAEVLPPELVEDMAIAERALQQLISVLPKSRFSKGKAVHVQFDGGSAKGHTMHSFQDFGLQWIKSYMTWAMLWT